MKILLDTNFLLTCAKQKVDFAELIGEQIDSKLEWIIPEEVIAELEDLSTRKDMKGKDKDAAKLALSLVERLGYESVRVNNKNVDVGIADFIRGKNIALATLDKKLKKRVENTIVTISDKRQVQIIN
ncbi:MAG: PIN domain-containing protein [archaeon]